MIHYVAALAKKDISALLLGLWSNGLLAAPVPVLQERNSQNISRPVRLIERSVFSDRMVFVRAVKESGWMGDVELAVYDSWFGPILDSNPSLVPDGFIYLQCQPTTCMQR